MSEPENIFSEEEIENLRELGDVLRRIVDRLVREGKAKIVEGKVVYLDKQENDE